MCFIHVLKVTYVHVHTCTDDYLPYFRLFISSFSILHSQAIERKIKLMNITLAVAALITHDIYFVYWQMLIHLCNQQD